MRHYPKSLLALALVSSVATLAFSSSQAQAQLGRGRPNLPSVEIHLEVLNSLRQSVQQAPRGYAAAPMPSVSMPAAIPSRGGEVITVPPAPNVSSGSSYAGEIARQIPSVSDREMMAANMPRHETIVQPLRHRTASGNEIIMQPLPGKNVIKVEPSEEEIVMQPLPPEAEGGEIVLSAKEPAQEVVVESPESVAVAAVEEKEESGSFLDTVTGWFSGDEEKPAAPVPSLKQPEVTALPEGGTPTPLVPNAPAETAEGESFFNHLQKDIQSNPQGEASPEPINPQEEMKETVESPSVVEQVTAVAEQPAAPVEIVKPVALPATPVAPVEVPKKSLTTPPILQEPGGGAALPVPEGFVVVDKSAAKADVVAEPVAPAIADAIQAEMPAPSDVPLTPLPTQETQGFPSLSEVNTSNSGLGGITELPRSAQDWLGEDSVPEPAPAAAPAESPATMAEEENPVVAMIQESVAQQPEAPIAAASEPTPDMGLTTLEQTEATPVTQEKKAEPKAVKPAVKEVKAKPKEKPAKKVAEKAPAVAEEKVEAPALPMTSAEESFLSNVQEPEKNAAEEGKPMLEAALDEVEPLQDVPVPEETAPIVPPPVEEMSAAPESAPAAAPLEEDFSLLAPEPASAPIVSAPAIKEKEEEGFLPGITRTFKNLLGNKHEDKAVVPPPPVPLPGMAEDKQATAENVLPPELPVTPKEEHANVMEHLPSQEVGTRFAQEELSLDELPPAPAPAPIPEPAQVEDENFVPDVVETISSPQAVVKKEISTNGPELKEMEVASLPQEPQPPKTSSLRTDLRIEYGVDDTDIPDAMKSQLTAIAEKANKEGRRVIITSFASGQEDESKAANMISLSRGLSLRAFFIDSGLAMDRIIVQAKGLENTGGPADRADITLD